MWVTEMTTEQGLAHLWARSVSMNKILVEYGSFRVLFSMAAFLLKQQSGMLASEGRHVDRAAGNLCCSALSRKPMPALLWKPGRFQIIQSTTHKLVLLSFHVQRCKFGKEREAWWSQLICVSLWDCIQEHLNPHLQHLMVPKNHTDRETEKGDIVSMKIPNYRKEDWGKLTRSKNEASPPNGGHWSVSGLGQRLWGLLTFLFGRES